MSKPNHLPFAWNPFFSSGKSKHSNGTHFVKWNERKVFESVNEVEHDPLDILNCVSVSLEVCFRREEEEAKKGEKSPQKKSQETTKPNKSKIKDYFSANLSHCKRSERETHTHKLTDNHVQQNGVNWTGAAIPNALFR